MCKEFDANILQDANKIILCLKSELLCRIPVLFESQTDSCLSDMTIFELADREGSLFVNMIKNMEYKIKPILNGREISEENVLTAVTNFTGYFWTELADFMNTSRFTLEFYLNKKDCSGSSIGSSRPDETVFINNFLVCKGEHKAHLIGSAIDELRDKLVDYNLFEYGHHIRFLPAYAAAGSVLEFCLIDVCTKQVHSVSQFHLSNKKDRLLAFVMSINVFRLIRTMYPFIQNLGTGMFKQINHITYYGYGKHVIKEVLTTSITAPTELYNVLKQGLINAVQVEKDRTQPKKGYTMLKISPQGIRIPNSGLSLSYQEMKCAIVCILTCFKSLHQQGFVHRDPRWTNVIRYHKIQDVNSIDFLVIDFEYSSNNGVSIEIENYIHKELVPFGSLYYNYHDLFLVGNMIKIWFHQQSVDITDPNVVEVISHLQSHLNGSDISIDDILRLNWFQEQP